MNYCRQYYRIQVIQTMYTCVVFKVPYYITLTCFYMFLYCIKFHIQQSTDEVKVRFECTLSNRPVAGKCLTRCYVLNNYTVFVRL